MRTLLAITVAALAVAPTAIASHTPVHNYCGESWRGVEHFEHVTSVRVPCARAKAIAWASTRDTWRKGRKVWRAYGWKWETSLGSDGSLTLNGRRGNRVIYIPFWWGKKPFTTPGTR